MGASLSLDFQTRSLNLNNNLHIDNRNTNSLGPAGRPPSDEVYHPYIQQNIHQHVDRGIDILHGAVAAAAIHDSAESYPQPKCHPETRTEMLEDLYDWALDEDAEKKILWLHGPAGAGKSAIMQTLARQLQDAGRLGGAFFFKRGDPTGGNGKALFATIAYQLALSVPWLRTQISHIVEKDPSIVERTIETQMIKLISEPCRSHADEDHVTILVDGLDECERHDVQQEILRVFESPVYSEIHRSFNVEQSFHDVEKYLCDEFGRIHREHRTMANIPLPWPSSDILWELVRKSSGYFIYASTIIKFVDDKSHRPMRRLALVLKACSTECESPFDALDQLYMTILCSAPRQSEFMPVLCIMAAHTPTISTIEELLGLEMGETELLLHGLHSVIEVSNRKDQIASYHASFLDFLADGSRSQKFYVGSLQNRMHLARYFLHFTAGDYRGKNAPLLELEPRHSQAVINRELMSLIMSLPPSVELCPLISHMNPEHIFNLESSLEDMKIPSAPHELIKLWEDYVFMYFFQSIEGDSPVKKASGGRKAQVETDSKISLQSEHISPSHEILQVLVAMVFLDIPFWRIPAHTDITWDEVRAINQDSHY
ncbi:hypothetical protein B0H14DRAFT_3863611 [Mycena olivaceomarginata]|nr:hypothetical protein B0H14DRAFT_3863611 [Mycena olivaceomarginata]